MTPGSRQTGMRSALQYLRHQVLGRSRDALRPFSGRVLRLIAVPMKKYGSRSVSKLTHYQKFAGLHDDPEISVSFPSYGVTRPGEYANVCFASSKSWILGSTRSRQFWQPRL